MRLKRRQIYASRANGKLKEQVNQIKMLYLFIECILNVICSPAVCLFQELFGGKYEGRKFNLIQQFKLWMESVLKFGSNLLFVTLALCGDTESWIQKLVSNDVACCIKKGLKYMAAFIMGMFSKWKSSMCVQ